MSDDNPVIPFDHSRVRATSELGHMVPGVLTAETIDSLRERKIIRDISQNIDLDPVNPGERIVGYLNNEERILFIEVASIDDELEELAREQHARSLEMFAKAVRNTATGKNPLRNMDGTILFPSEEAAEEYFGLMTNLEYLRAIYNNSIRSRYGHSKVLGVRQGFAVVAIRSKYEIPPEVIEQYGP